MMKYRDFMSLSNSEIEFIINDIFKPNEIKTIRRDYSYKEIQVTILWHWDNNTEIEDELILKEDMIDCPFQKTADDNRKYIQYLFSKGVHELLKNNPYLVEE